MEEYLKQWEEYVSTNYNPNEINRCKLEELHKIADIMKDMAEYWSHKMDAGLV